MSALLLPHGDKHAEHVFDVVRGGYNDAANDVVARSWRRCLNEYQLHPDRPHELPVVSQRSLEERLQRMGDVIDCARHEMTTLYQQLGDAESAVVLTDTDGVILHMVSSPEFAAEVGPMGLRAGAVWSETEAGTNGMGTCLASASPVAVRREDHFFTQFTGLTCSAVPVYGPSGELCGVLDLSSRSSLMQQHLLVFARHDGPHDREPPDRPTLSHRPTRCTFTRDPSSCTPCTRGVWRWTTMVASWPPTAARCSSWGCSR